MLVESRKKLTGNARFEGFAIDLAKELSLVLGFNFTFKLVDDNKVSVVFPSVQCMLLLIFSLALKYLLATGMVPCWERLWMVWLTST